MPATKTMLVDAGQPSEIQVVRVICFLKSHEAAGPGDLSLLFFVEGG